MIMNKFLIPVLGLMCVTAAACGVDDEPFVPVNAITLNMTVGDSETTIGGSDVFINSSYNFATSRCGIADMGRNGGFDRNPELAQIAQEVAVTPGNYYQIILANNIRTVAGARAVPVRANFYNVHVDSWIYDKDNDIAGAKVSYAETIPQTNKLPAWDYVFPVDLYKEGFDYEYTFDRDVVIDPDYSLYDYENSDMAEHLTINIKNNSITISGDGGGYGKAEVIVLVRYKSMYTRVEFFVN